MSKPKASLILPNQLFKTHPCISHEQDTLLILAEDPLFFGDETYPANFHKQKLVLHRATMKNYEKKLKSLGYKVLYLEASLLKHGTRSYVKQFKEIGIASLQMVDPVDEMVEKRLNKAAEELGIPLRFVDNPGFLTKRHQIEEYFFRSEHFSFTPFYITQRKRFGILIDHDGKPNGGKWSFDTENRKRAPKGMTFPTVLKSLHGKDIEEAIAYVEANYPENPGLLNAFAYPLTHEDAKKWLDTFVAERLEVFGDYEDAILQNEIVMMHSVLTPALNIGLITPYEVVKTVLDYSNKHPIPLNSLEGFIRQVIGWREYIRGVYCTVNVKQRKTNFWGHHRKIPSSFYTGTTGIAPVDNTIKKLLKHAYCHHIERLMVLGSFMLLCEFDPDDVYRWFMEMFIDSYDWVMVPNVYGMSQYADGGLMTTKPYICGSNYIRKMSDYKAGDWCQVWDALFWRFMHKHRTFFKSQIRLNMLCAQIDKMDQAKIDEHYSIAETFLNGLDRKEHKGRK